MSMPTPVPPPLTPGNSAPKKGLPWLWILGGCFGVMFLAGVAIVVTVFYVGHKAKQAFEEHVSIKKDANGKDSVEFKGLGPDGNSTVQVGGEAKEPEWMPVYPGSKIKPLTNIHTSAQIMDSYMFTTSDSPEAVSKFYDDKFKADGFETIANLPGFENGTKKTSLVHAGKKSEGYTVQVTSVSGDNGETSVQVMAIKTITAGAKDAEVEQK